MPLYVPKIMIHKLFLASFFSFFSFAASAQDLEEPNLYVFVGQKISLEEFEPELEEDEFVMDALFRARYKVIKQVYNSLPTDTLKFIAPDHYGVPAFSNFEHVLLYVVKTSKGYIHEKYLYSPVYKTIDGDWAGPYEARDYNHSFNKETSIEPVRIEWQTPPSFEYEKVSTKKLKERFPVPYYQVDDKTVTVIFGNYVQELFRLKKNGFLKARGYFD